MSRTDSAVDDRPSFDIEVLEVLEHTFPAMGTEVHVVLVGGDDHHAEWLEDQVHSAERMLSRFLDDSEVRRVGRSAGRPVSVSPLTLDLLREAEAARRLTAGAFDATLGRHITRAGYDRPLSEFDRVVRGDPWPPARPAEESAEIIIDADRGTVQVPHGCEIDVGGIAKGFLADRFTASLMARGLLGVCLNIGGDLRTRGRGDALDTWTIAVDHHHGVETAVTVAEAGIATSTIARRWWLGPDGEPRHHLLDPSTRCSATTDLVSVTVVAPDATTAEVLTKVAFTRPERLDSLLGTCGAWAFATDRQGRPHRFGSSTDQEPS